MMNRGIPEMVVLQCLHTFENVSRGAELTMLDRQRLHIKWQQRGLVCNNVCPVSAQEDGQFQGQLSRDVARTGFGNYGMPNVEDFVSCGYAGDSGIALNYQMAKTCPMVSVIGEISGGKESILTGSTNLGGAADNSKKRKAEAAKVAPNGDTKELKKLKERAEDGESKVTQHNKSTSNKSRGKADEALVVSEVQKTDYIHVRARRGQATDSHSLAERVRREKISERMKYLQELVPGCNKIIGKAGMLDEIINYVQSLQRQVEFLSMKLATIDLQLNFSLDNPFGKEVFTPCASSYPTLGEMSELANPTYLQVNPLEEQVLVPSRMDTENYQPELGIQQELTKTFVDITSLNHSSFTWEAGVMEIQGGFINFPSAAMDQ